MGGSYILMCPFGKMTHSYPVRDEVAKAMFSFLRNQAPFILKVIYDSSCTDQFPCVNIVKYLQNKGSENWTRRQC